MNPGLGAAVNVTAWIASAVLGAVALVLLARRLRLARVFGAGTPEVEGYYIGILGTIYAVLLAFMVFVVWLRFEHAENLVDEEASALCDLYRVARTLPDDAREAINRDCRRYAEVVQDEEWRAMAAETQSPQLGQVLDRLLTTVTRVQAAHLGSSGVREKLLGTYFTLDELRRERLLVSRTHLPGVLWGMLLFGAALNVAFASAFGAERFGPHAAKAAVVAALLAATLYVTWLLDRPYRGAVRVRPTSFESCPSRFDRTDRIPPGRATVIAARPAPGRPQGR